jgi:ribosome maturation protein Sdo1
MASLMSMAEIRPTFKISPELLKNFKIKYLTYIRALAPANQIKKEMRKVSINVYFNDANRLEKTLNSFGAFLSDLKSSVHKLSVFFAWLNVMSKYI